MDPQEYARRRYAETKPSMAWTRDSIPEMVKWQTRTRTRLRKLLGLPRERPPLEARVEEVQDLDGYRREAIRFRSRPGLDAFGFFLIPHDCPPGQPTILCLAGHGRGVDSLVGIRPDGSQRRMDEPEEYQADFALQCVRHGYPAFALEQISFGRRRDAKAEELGGDSSSCTRDTMAAFMLGETMVGWRVWDAIRALDYLETRPEVDSQRMATMGISGGGVTSLWTACLDLRVEVAVVSGYFNTFRDSILSIDHCVDNYVPSLLGVIEMPDLAGLVAPRGLFVESGRDDPIFPLKAFEAAAARAEVIYSAFEASQQFGMEVFDGGHRFHGLGAFEFLEQALIGRVIIINQTRR